MIIDDSVSFFGVYYHNCIFHLNLSKEFADIYSKEKYRNIILCQKDTKGGYLLTQSISSKTTTYPYVQSYYFVDIAALRCGYKKSIEKIENAEKTFYLIISSQDYNIDHNQDLVKSWKKNIKEILKNEKENNQ